MLTFALAVAALLVLGVVAIFYGQASAFDRSAFPEAFALLRGARRRFGAVLGTLELVPLVVRYLPANRAAPSPANTHRVWIRAMVAGPTVRFTLRTAPREAWAALEGVGPEELQREGTFERVFQVSGLALEAMYELLPASVRLALVRLALRSPRASHPGDTALPKPGTYRERARTDAPGVQLEPAARLELLARRGAVELYLEADAAPGDEQLETALRLVTRVAQRVPDVSGAAARRSIGAVVLGAGSFALLLGGLGVYWLYESAFLTGLRGTVLGRHGWIGRSGTSYYLDVLTEQGAARSVPVPHDAYTFCAFSTYHRGPFSFVVQCDQQHFFDFHPLWGLLLCAAGMAVAWWGVKEARLLRRNGM